MTADERFDWLAGQVDAIKAFMLASIESHPNIEAFSKEFEKASEVQLGQVLPQKISDHYLQGLQTMVEDIRRFLE
jgi:hypothetical protein